MLLAESDAERRAASEGFGAHLFALSGGAEAGGKRWGLLWGAEVVETEPEARALLGDAKKSGAPAHRDFGGHRRSEEHTSELQSLMRNSYAVFSLKKKKSISHLLTHIQ